MVENLALFREGCGKLAILRLGARRIMNLLKRFSLGSEVVYAA